MYPATNHYRFPFNDKNTLQLGIRHTINTLMGRNISTVIRSKNIIFEPEYSVIAYRFLNNDNRNIFTLCSLMITKNPVF